MKRVIKAIYSANPHEDWTKKWRVINGVKANGYHLSIQSSKGHYCSPRETLDNLEEYSSFEMAIDKVENSVFKALEDPILRSWDGFDELMTYGDGVGSEDDGYFPIYGFVPIEVINSLYLYLRKLEKV